MAIDWGVEGYLARTTDTLSKEMTFNLNAEWQERAVMKRPEKSPPSRDHSMNKGHGLAEGPMLGSELCPPKMHMLKPSHPMW